MKALVSLLGIIATLFFGGIALVVIGAMGISLWEEHSQLIKLLLSIALAVPAFAYAYRYDKQKTSQRRTQAEAEASK